MPENWTLMVGLLRRAILALPVLLAAGCGGEDGPGGLPSTEITQLVFSRTSAKMLAGGTVQVQATALNSDGIPQPTAPIAWSSSNTAVASVSPAGLVSALTPGLAFIRAQAGEVTDSMQLEVATAQFDTVAAGGYHVCALTADGEAYCWGENFNGALGTGDTVSSATPLAVRTSLRFTSISLSPRSTCGVATTGDSYCWGNNSHGQLGLGSQDNGDHMVPARVIGGLSFSSLSAGLSSTCGVTVDGSGYCWGWNVDGLLGTGVAADVAFPTLVAGGLTFRSISTGQLHACGITTSGAAYCWGDDDGGRLGTGTGAGDCGGFGGLGCTRVPVAVAGGLTFSELSATQTHTCAITTGGAGYCWGNSYLGNGSVLNSYSSPTPVSGGHTLHGVTSGNDANDGNAAHTCAIDFSGQGYCWGDNSRGQLGTGDMTVAWTPVAISGGLSWQSLTAAGNQSCGLATDQRVYCWGLGAGSLTPVVISGQP